MGATGVSVCAPGMFSIAEGVLPQAVTCLSRRLIVPAMLNVQDCFLVPVSRFPCVFSQHAAVFPATVSRVMLFKKGFSHTFRCRITEYEAPPCVCDGM